MGLQRWHSIALVLLIFGACQVFSKPATSASGRQEFNPATDDALPLDRYFSHNEMHTWLQGVAERYPQFTKLYSIGKSVEGRDLWVLQMSNSVGRGRRDLLMPQMKLVGNIHGNEVVGRQLLLQTISYLIQRANSDERVFRLLNTTDVHILPSMNPDGFVKAQEGDCWQGGPESGRLNANNVDLNRDFPDQFRPTDQLLRSRDEMLQGRQPETAAIMSWILDNHFVLSSSLHGGALVVSYPFDGSPQNQTQGFYSAAPDDAVFRMLSNDYASRHLTMKKPEVCGWGDGFKDGITNGAYWYDLKGGMQDFNYVKSNTFELTLELSCCKYPPSNELPTEWENNRKALLSFIASTHLGVRGLILDADSNRPAPGAYIAVEGIEKNIKSTERGEFWRILTPGNYVIQAFADGYEPSEKREIQISKSLTEQVVFKLAKKTIGDR